MPPAPKDGPPPRPTTLGAHLDRARHAQFVGRAAELGAFAEALRADRLPFHVAHVWGPGGIGKTALLDEVARLCDEAAVPVVRVDGRDLDPEPAAVARAAAPLGGGRSVLLVDTYERLGALDGWFQRTFVPGLPAGVLVVLAGRDRPAPEWRVGWGGAVRMVALRNLGVSDAQAFLDRRGVPGEAWEGVLSFTHGHPLALALVAERFRERPDAAPPAFDAAHEPAVVRALLDRFMADVPTPAHRAAVEGSSVVRTVSEPLLAALLGEGGAGGGGAGEGEGGGGAGEAHEAFEWLRGLSFVEAGPAGVRLHDLVRETVEADLRWRDPARYAALHGRARRHYSGRLQRPASDAARRETLADYVHLYRDNPVVRPLMGRLLAAWAGARVEGPTPLAPGDVDAVAALAARHEGAASAAVVRRWAERRPEAVEVFRDGGGAVAGFLLTLRLGPAGPDGDASDPALGPAWAAVGGRLRPDETALLFRSWMDADAYQGVSTVQSLVFARTVQCYLSTPGLAVSLLAVADPNLWAPVFAFAGLRPYPEAAFAVGGRAYAVFGRDWRASPPAEWLDGLAGQSPDRAPAPPALDAADALVVLSEGDFADAARRALKAYARPHRLADNPLLRSRLVRERGGDEVEALRALLREAAEELRAGVRDVPYFRALQATYLDPEPTQAAAAERLGLPFSTFRRHLGRGVDHVVEALWRRETGG
ncbi:ATP-binding protein [Rubrivirga sp. S365]|uniref:ATP-binding protein n=1 Tax=Rubrivirga litoralis TaxID=3075598 RepID=A0ABU3BLS4_9BACT|nr:MULTISPECIES: ATP-binding protein [unclassified Rubrivirga]MDT0630233.1 ATP-binding protein [Rubrivirga sp. F394]MDT7855744.1 ATP-binding protein [Rubrivirga sp. S365]